MLTGSNILNIILAVLFFGAWEMVKKYKIAAVKTVNELHDALLESGEYSNSSALNACFEKVLGLPSGTWLDYKSKMKMTLIRLDYNL